MRPSNKVGSIEDKLPLVLESPDTNNAADASATSARRMIKWAIALTVLTLLVCTTVLLVTLYPLFNGNNLDDTSIDTIDIYIMSPSPSTSSSTTSAPSSSSSSSPQEDVFIVTTVEIPSLSDMHSVEFQDLQCTFFAFGHNAFATANVSPLGRIGPAARTAQLNITVSASDYNVLARLRGYAMTPEAGSAGGGGGDGVGG